MYACVENWNNILITKSLRETIGDDFEIAYQKALNVVLRRMKASRFSAYFS